MAVVLPIAEPNPEAMRQHIRELFWYDYRDGEFDAKIELAWTDAKSHALNHAKLFGLDEIDLLIDEAVEINSIPNQNVYVGVALRKAATNPSRRAKDADFYSLKCAYADLDEEGAADSAAAKYHGVQPTFVVVTGEHPHFRAHLYWRLDEPIRDPQEYRETISLIAENFGGDPAVTNPSRVMRLGGTVAWPLKKGRKVEATQVYTFDDGRPATYPASALQKAWKQKKLADLDIGVYEGIDPEACAKAIKQGENLHINTRNLIAHRVGLGWRDEQISDEATSLLKPVSDGKTLKQIDHFIDSARRKYGVVEPDPQVSDIFVASNWYGKEPEPREWIVEDWVPAKYVTGFYGNGGTGKSLLAQQLLTASAIGDKWLGMDVTQNKSFGLFCEDELNELHNRQVSINRDLGITARGLDDLGFMSRASKDNILMNFDAKGQPVLTPLWHELCSKIKEFGAKLVVIDTAADTFGGNESVRPEVRQYIASCCGGLGREIGGTVVVCAHPSVAGMQSGQGYGGSTAWHNTFRSVLYLEKYDDEDHQEDNDLRQLTRKKANYASSGEQFLLRYTEGVLAITEDDTEARDSLSGVSMEVARNILNEIHAKWEAEKPYSRSNNTGERYVVRMMMSKFKMRKKQADRLQYSWWTEGVIEEEIVNKRTKLKGLKVLKWF